MRLFIIKAIFRCLSETLLPMTAVASPRSQNGDWMGNMFFNHRMPLNSIKECVETKITITAGDLNPDLQHTQPNRMSTNIKNDTLNGGCRQAMVHREYWRGARHQMPSMKILNNNSHRMLVKQILISGKASHTNITREHVSSV